MCLLFQVNKCDAQEVYFKQWIQTLTDSSLGGRPAGTDYELKALHKIEHEIKQSGFNTKQQRFSYLDPDSAKQLHAFNLYSFINHKADSTILISAHYDHLGKNKSKSKEIRIKTFHPGANDNASGVAMLLYLLKTKKQWMSRRYNYLIVFYSAHEVGLFGSETFYKQIGSTFKLKTVINYDMVGRLYQHQLHIATNSTMPVHMDTIQIVQEKEELLNQLDTKAYFQHGIQCYNVSTGLFPEYHTTQDTENRINYQGMVQIYHGLKKWLYALSK